MMSTFWCIVKLTIIGIFEITWILFVFAFYFLPLLIINNFKRIHIKNKMQRRLVKNGLPRKQAKNISLIYKKHLFRYSSLRGIMNLTKLGVKYSRSLKRNESIAKKDEGKIKDNIIL